MHQDFFPMLHHEESPPPILPYQNFQTPPISISFEKVETPPL